METILLGIGDALVPANLMWVAIGVAIGIIVGAIPGLNGPLAIAVAIPLTYSMSPLAAIAFLVGILKGSHFGGAVPAILLNTPGTPESVCTTLDGAPLARAGKPKKAMRMALVASITGDVMSDIVLFTLAAPMAIIGLWMGPAEMAGLYIFALTMVSGVAGSSIWRGLIAVLFGALLATSGLDFEVAQLRLTFGIVDLYDGIPVLPLMVGLLAVSEMIHQCEEVLKQRIEKFKVEVIKIDGKDDTLTWAEYVRCFPTIVRGGLIGIIVGLIPGPGAIVAGLLSYTSAKQASDTPEEFGKGKLEGLAATEAGNSSVTGVSMVPLITLGVPASLSAAILFGAFLIHGIVPGPTIFRDHGQIVYGMFFLIFLANWIHFIFGNLGLPLFAQVVRIPMTVIIPSVLILCVASAYSEGSSMFYIVVMMVGGIFGYVMNKLGFPIVALVLGFVLSPGIEQSFRQAAIILSGEPLSVVFRHPIALGLIAVTLFSVTRMAGGKWTKLKKKPA